MGRKERLNEVYEYVRKHFPIHTQVDFAEKLKYHRTYISSAMHGNEKNLTDKLFRNVCEAFPGVFNLDYLLTGEGSLLLNEKPQQTQKMEQTADILELYAQRVRLVDDLRQTLKEELEEVRTIRAELLQARNDFREATYRLTQALRTLSPNSTIDIAADEK
jgi:transcriptional regulator with XRE-family HTH domain